jgi:hypothetical protein
MMDSPFNEKVSRKGDFFYLLKVCLFVVIVPCITTGLNVQWFDPG